MTLFPRTSCSVTFTSAWICAPMSCCQWQHHFPKILMCTTKELTVLPPSVMKSWWCSTRETVLDVDWRSFLSSLNFSACVDLEGRVQWIWPLRRPQEVVLCPLFFSSCTVSDPVFVTLRIPPDWLAFLLVFRPKKGSIEQNLRIKKFEEERRGQESGDKTASTKKSRTWLAMES